MTTQVRYEVGLPPVQGRHRNRALAEARRLRAANLIVSGCTYQQVADRLGYQNRGTVHRLVQPLLRATSPQSLDEAFELHLARLEALLAVNFNKALERDPQATRTVLKVLNQISALLGLFDTDEAVGSSQDYEVLDPAELVRRRRATEETRPR